jgi:monoterpene epsilon-lactone hydrolase
MRRVLLLWLRALWASARGRGAGRPLRPGWPFGLEVVIRFLRLDWDETAAWPSARLRADLDARPVPSPARRLVRREDDRLGGVEVRRVRRRKDAGPGVILFLHGGSYAYGSCRTTHAGLVDQLAASTGAEVVGVEYRLAPEHPYPAQLEDALAAWRALTEGGVSARRVVVAGDSSGGNLALALALALRNAGRPLPSGLLLLSPWSDLTMPAASFVANDPYDFGTRAVLHRQALEFAGGIPLEDPRLSPVRADLVGLPPALVVMGEVEIPRGDIEALVRRFRDCGGDVDSHLARDLPHNPLLFASLHPEGRAALDAAAAFVARRLDA